MALWAAVQDDDRHLTEELLRAGVDPNELSEYDESLLELAIANGNRDIVEVLTRYGADPNYENGAGLTPIMLGVLQPDILEVILRNSQVPLDLDLASDYDNRTALAKAADQHQIRSVVLLLYYGADPSTAQLSAETDEDIRTRISDWEDWMRDLPLDNYDEEDYDTLYDELQSRDILPASDVSFMDPGELRKYLRRDDHLIHLERITNLTVSASIRKDGSIFPHYATHI